MNSENFHEFTSRQHIIKSSDNGSFLKAATWNMIWYNELHDSILLAISLNSHFISFDRPNNFHRPSCHYANQAQRQFLWCSSGPKFIGLIRPIDEERLKWLRHRCYTNKNIDKWINVTAPNFCKKACDHLSSGGHRTGFDASNIITTDCHLPFSNICISLF